MFLYRNDHKSSIRGDIRIATENIIKLTDVSASDSIEFIFWTLQLPKEKQMVIGAYYRPLNRVDDEYLSKTYEEISSLRST